MKKFLFSLATILCFCCFNVMNAQECADTDNGAVDAYGDGCDGYTSFPSWCNGYDDDDFISSEMCCACGGGETSALPVSTCEDDSACNFGAEGDCQYLDCNGDCGGAAIIDGCGVCAGDGSTCLIECLDTDNGATDSYGDGCAGYTSFPSWW